ncbi:TrkA family potassium uptake protein [Porphyromonas pogonae]|uniref:potassium channel family protein n=1 Tax=Porphyromonas pogonae TaxID=867595 RepID=UPI002E79489F|nr:TrkA family potassium uptake protein [Porphyromonas pogonae]
MKFIVIGLGLFGSSIARELQGNGNEVIGVDREMALIEEIKDDITYALCLDCERESEARSLPLEDADWIIVAIGGNSGSNLLVSALMKRISSARIACRIIQPLQEEILRAIGVDIVIRPELESAIRWSKKFSYKSLLDYMNPNEHFSIMRIAVPDSFVGKTISQLNVNKHYEIIFLNVEKSNSNNNSNKLQIELARADTKLEGGDIITVYGNNQDMRKLLKTFDE